MLLMYCDTKETLLAIGYNAPDQTEYVFETTEDIDEELLRAMERWEERWATAGSCGGWRWKREPWCAPERPEKLRGLRQYAAAKVIPTPPGGALYLKCARRFEKWARTEPTGRLLCSSVSMFIPLRGRTAAPATG